MSTNNYQTTNPGNNLDPSANTSNTNPAAGGYVPNTHSLETGPAPNTAGSHQSDLLNKLDPQVDSDLNNRAQYAPGTTATNNTHAGATKHVSHPASSNDGPHPSSIMNKLDPRVNSKTGEMTTKTTNGEGSGPAKEPVQHGSNVAGGQSQVVPGSSTDAPAAPNTASGSSYNKNAPQAYNPAVGTGYNPGSNTTGGSNQAGAPVGSSTGASGNSGNAGSGIKGVLAGIHGMGESLRGSLGAAVDRSFGDEEGARKNQAIASQGEYEVQSGNFAKSTQEREGVNVNKRQERQQREQLGP